MTAIHAAVVVSAFLCSLVAGFLFAFAVVIMPGIKSLDDDAFLRAFQVVDGVIQKGQPLFIVVWVGSALSLLATAGMGIWSLNGANRALLIAATVVFLGGVQLPTAAINIPMNNALQRLELGSMDAAARTRARADFEARWNRWNVFRTIVAAVATTMLLIVLLRM
jgi:uncharacterized membrane protein